MELAKVAKLYDNTYVSLNVLNHNKLDFDNEDNIFLRIGNTVYKSTSIDKFERGTIGINTFVRSHLGLAINDFIPVKLQLPIDNKIKTLNIRIVPHNLAKEIYNIHEEEIKEQFVKYFKKHYLYSNQCLYLDLVKIRLVIYITNKVAGYCTNETTIEINSDNTSLNIIGSKLMKRDLFRDDYNFEEIGIGGLDKQLVDVLRRCLSTRAYSQRTIDRFGIKHVKGMLLYGPPGTGKTLIARKIGSLISNIQPKIVNGPEIVNKYVGESEKNIRELFHEAINDKSENLHIIIFDEIDAICKKRNGSGNGLSGVNDSIVNQLLTMIDGYNALNNIFVIGMTNRKDLLDEALLRAGRLEAHIEINLPNKKGREQIFRIHTKSMTTNKLIEDFDKNLELYTDLTENYSGAEIEAIVRNAVSRALHENLIITKDKEEIITKDKEEINQDLNQDLDQENIIIKKKHFLEAIQEIIPVFGSIPKDALLLIPENFSKGTNYRILTEFIQNAEKKINSILIIGKNQSGKTSLAVKAGFDCKIKNTKIIRAIDLVTYDEFAKAQYIADIVKNSYISEESLIIIDDIEIAVNYVNLDNHPIFSNRLYQVLITLLKTQPTHNHKITFVCTCTDKTFSDSIKKFFNEVIRFQPYDSIITI